MYYGNIFVKFYWTLLCVHCSAECRIRKRFPCLKECLFHTLVLRRVRIIHPKLPLALLIPKEVLLALSLWIEMMRQCVFNILSSDDTVYTILTSLFILRCAYIIQ